jgi:hypothetical protein
MTHPITLTMPDQIYDPIMEIAEAKSVTVEEVGIAQLRSVQSVTLPSLPADEESELIAFKFLSDDTLRAIAREQMLKRDQSRMQLLMTRNNMGDITADERDELAALVERGQRLTLRKAWGAAILIERGYAITADDMADENG